MTLLGENEKVMNKFEIIRCCHTCATISNAGTDNALCLSAGKLHDKRHAFIIYWRKGKKIKLTINNYVIDIYDRVLMTTFEM